MTYQTQWCCSNDINGGFPVGEGDRTCENRYLAILGSIRGLFDRPITILDLGCDIGYFAMRLAHALPDSVCVGVESHDLFMRRMKDHVTQPNIIFLHHRLSLEDIHELSSVEHFDVVLALNVMHHWPNPANESFSAVLSLAEYAFVETPTPDDKKAIGNPEVKNGLHNLASAGDRIATAASHTCDTPRTIYLHRSATTGLSKPYFNADMSILPPCEISITSDRDEITATNQRKGCEFSWLPGINLHTYLSLGGKYPTSHSLADAIETSENCFLPNRQRHGDIRSWNFILTREEPLGRTGQPYMQAAYAVISPYIIDGRDELAQSTDDDADRAHLVQRLRSHAAGNNHYGRTGDA